MVSPLKQWEGDGMPDLQAEHCTKEGNTAVCLETRSYNDDGVLDIYDARNGDHDANLAFHMPDQRPRSICVTPTESFCGHDPAHMMSPRLSTTTFTLFSGG